MFFMKKHCSFHNEWVKKIVGKKHVNLRKEKHILINNVNVFSEYIQAFLCNLKLSFRNISLGTWEKCMQRQMVQLCSGSTYLSIYNSLLKSKINRWPWTSPSSNVLCIYHFDYFFHYEDFQTHIPLFSQCRMNFPDSMAFLTLPLLKLHSFPSLWCKIPLQELNPNVTAYNENLLQSQCFHITSFTFQFWLFIPVSTSHLNCVHSQSPSGFSQLDLYMNSSIPMFQLCGFRKIN